VVPQGTAEPRLGITGLGFRHLVLEGGQCYVYQTYISKMSKKKGWGEEGLWLSANENLLNYKFNGYKNTGKEQTKIRFKWGKKPLRALTGGCGKTE